MFVLVSSSERLCRVTATTRWDSAAVCVCVCVCAPLFAESVEPFDLQKPWFSMKIVLQDLPRECRVRQRTEV